MEIHLSVGTKNPTKINAVQLAFERIYPQATIITRSYKVASGVADQPMSPEESIIGARNRAQASLDKDQQATYGVGLEGGLEQIGDDWFDCGWCVIVDRHNQEGIASSARIPTPKTFMDKINQGIELGEVVDILFKTQDSKQKEGHFGLMTNNALTRTEGYIHGICLAFSRFLHPEFFKKRNS